MLKGRSCQKAMMGCWGTTFVPPNHSVTGRFVPPSSDSRVPLPTQKNYGTYRYSTVQKVTILIQTDQVKSIGPEL